MFFLQGVYLHGNIWSSHLWNLTRMLKSRDLEEEDVIQYEYLANKPILVVDTTHP